MLFFLSICFGRDGCAGEGEGGCGEGFVLVNRGVGRWIHFELRLTMLEGTEDVGEGRCSEWGVLYLEWILSG